MDELKQKVEDIQDFLKEYEDFPEVIDELHKICMMSIYSKRVFIDHADFLSRTCLDCVRNDEINVRTYNACRWAGLETLSDVLRYGKKNLLRVPAMGEKSMTELEEFLKKNGVEFYN